MSNKFMPNPSLNADVPRAGGRRPGGGPPVSFISLGSMTLHNTGSEGMRRIVNSLLEYLERNPDASDTLDGISQWWFPTISPPSTP
jgi:hypothetical protein